MTYRGLVYLSKDITITDQHLLDFTIPHSRQNYHTHTHTHTHTLTCTRAYAVKARLQSETNKKIQTEVKKEDRNKERI